MRISFSRLEREKKTLADVREMCRRIRHQGYQLVGDVVYAKERGSTGTCFLLIFVGLIFLAFFIPSREPSRIRVTLVYEFLVEFVREMMAIEAT